MFIIGLLSLDAPVFGINSLNALLPVALDIASFSLIVLEALGFHPPTQQHVYIPNVNHIPSSKYSHLTVLLLGQNFPCRLYHTHLI